MPKNIVATPAAVVAVDRLTLQADDARGDGLAPSGMCDAQGCLTFSEE